MANFKIELMSSLPPRQALEAVLNPVAQTKLIPLTSVRRDGDIIRTRTGGRLIGFDDDMRVERCSLEPPGVHIRKLGQTITGEVWITVDATEFGSKLTWEQEIQIRGIPPFADPFVTSIARWGYGRILQRLLIWPRENERISFMANITLRGNEVTTVGNLPLVGGDAPDFELTGVDLESVKLSDFDGKRVVLNIFPSVDTGVCATSVRTFNERAAGLDNTAVLCVSQDLPMALGRFCAAEGIENVVAASGFRSSFADDYGVRMTDGKLRGLCSRAVVVLDENHVVVLTEQVPEIGQEPDYDAAIAALEV